MRSILAPDVRVEALWRGGKLLSSRLKQSNAREV